MHPRDNNVGLRLCFCSWPVDILQLTALKEVFRQNLMLFIMIESCPCMFKRETEGSRRRRTWPGTDMAGFYFCFGLTQATARR